MNWTKVVLANLVIAIVLLLVLEIFAAAIFYFYKGELIYGKAQNDLIFVNEHLSKHYRANIILKVTPGHLYVDEKGFVKTKNPSISGIPKLLLIGGSTVEGRGASSNNSTIASYLSKCLSKNEKPYEVLNAGRSGLTSYTAFRLLIESFLPKYKPEVVVQLNGRNDFHYSLENQLGKLNYFTSDVRNFEKIKYIDGYGVSFTQWLEDFARSTHLSRIITSVVKKFLRKVKDNKIYEEFVELKDEEMKLRAKVTSKHLLSQIINTKTISKLYDADYYHFLQPTLLYGDKKPTKKELFHINEWHSRSYLGKKYSEELKYFYDAFRARSNSLSNDLSLLFSDLDYVNLYNDSVHYNDKANELIANAICNKILETKK